MNNICDICIFFHVQYISYISASLHIWAYLGSPKHWVFTNSTMSQGLQILQLLGSKPRNEAPWHRWRINHARLCPPKKQTMPSKKSCRIIPEKTSSPHIPYFFHGSPHLSVSFGTCPTPQELRPASILRDDCIANFRLKMTHIFKSIQSLRNYWFFKGCLHTERPLLSRTYSMHVYKVLEIIFSCDRDPPYN